jgi:hypothetical protein
MRKPDPTRFTGKRKPDKLEMKGFSTPLPQEAPGEEEEQGDRKTSESTDVRPDERTYERTQVPSQERKKIRHAFDVFEDQLRALHTLQLEAVRVGSRKPKLGQMVQQALDAFLDRMKGMDDRTKDVRSSERTNVPTDERTDKFDKTT